MLWCDRPQMAGLTPRPTLAGGLVILFFGLAWFAAYLSGIAEGTQFAFVGILQGVLLTLFGWRVYLRLVIPFSYLWLLVPSGQFLIPELQTITAAAAAHLLDLSGIPTWRSGLNIDVPTGSYVVAPGCAGLNFVLAALATGLAYAELVYRSWGRRLGFIAGLLALAVAGNVLRVFLIIAIAHLTNNVGDIVDDHLVYGWGFFSFLLLAAMFFGQRFRQDLSTEGPARPLFPAGDLPRRRALLIAAVLAVVLSAALPVAARVGWPDLSLPRDRLDRLSCGALPAGQEDGGWPSRGTVTDRLAIADCQQDGKTVHLLVAGLDRPIRQGKLIGLEDRLNEGERWNRTERRTAILSLAGREVPARIDYFSQGPRRRLVVSLFWADGDWRRPGLPSALADLRADLARRRHAALVTAATEADDGDDAALDRLERFLAAQPLAALAQQTEHP